MVMLKIIAFFGLMTSLIIMTWLWHWIWFGSGADFVNNRLAPLIIGRAADRQAAALVVVNVVKVGLVVLLLAGAMALFLLTYSLLT